MRIDDPSRAAFVPVPTRAEPPRPGGPRAVRPDEPAAGHGAAHDAVYLAVHRSAAFREVRSRYRRFVLPATAGFLLWYLAYLVVATTAPGLMARPLVGVVNLGMAAGLAQFVTTFALTFAYMRHARLHRDRAALELRWETQDLTRVSETETVR